MTKTVRLEDKTIELLKILKVDLQVSTYEKVISELSHIYLRKKYAVTNDGYLPVGAVVEIEGRTVVIQKVDEMYVCFSDKTKVFNGSISCSHIKLLETNIQNYKGTIE